MSTVVDSPAPSRQAVPDPGQTVPSFSWPIAGIFAGAFALFAVGSWLALEDRLTGVTIAMNAVAVFVMFTVLHDASHYSVSSNRAVNNAFGRVAMFFVSPLIAFKAFGFIHIEHHRNTNHDERDPDHFASHGPWWQLPFRFAAMDVPYVGFYVRNIKRRPRAELVETAVLVLAFSGVVAASIATGTFWLLAVIYLIPQRVAMTFLAWWFDWLPHHGREETQTENRYRATRNRVGMEWLFTPLMLSQNYHLVHHLHPSVPFYRYVKTWRRNEDAYLAYDPAITTVFGQDLDADEYREWKRLNSRLQGIVPTRMPERSSATHGVFHRLPVAAVDPITADSTLVTFAVPEELSDEFRFEPGQHVTVQSDDVRRNYSICAPATQATLRIGVKHIPDGAFSTFVKEQLTAGDVLEVMTPTGNFCPPLHPLNEKHYVAIAAGSGITPVLSILQTTMELEPESRFTLIYANRTKDSMMFGRELDDLESRYADRLEIVHVLSRDSGRIDDEKLEGWLEDLITPSGVDEWFLCGPVELVTLVRDTLIERDVDAEHIHLELFTGYDKTSQPQGEYEAATVTFRLAGGEQTAELQPDESILEAALQVRPDVPYACMGGACGTCRAKLVEGTAEMDQNFALSPADLEAGYVLTCQSHPTSATVTVDYDA